MFACLRHPALIRRDHKHDQIQVVRARKHIFDEALVPRHIYKAKVNIANRQIRKADVNRDSALFFFLEAVGIGARWRVTSLVHVSGIEVRQVSEYTLRERDGSQVVVDVKLTQSAARQRAALPGVPNGTKVEITKWKGSGTGGATLSLVQPLPLASEMHASGTQFLDVSGQGQRGTLIQKITTDVKVSH